jgi:hypothetical protein
MMHIILWLSRIFLLKIKVKVLFEMQKKAQSQITIEPSSRVSDGSSNYLDNY